MPRCVQRVAITFVDGHPPMFFNQIQSCTHSFARGDQKAFDRFIYQGRPPQPKNGQRRFRYQVALCRFQTCLEGLELTVLFFERVNVFDQLHSGKTVNVRVEPNVHVTSTVPEEYQRQDNSNVASLFESGNQGEDVFVCGR